MDCTMGFITIFRHHLGEFVWVTFSKHLTSKSKSKTYILCCVMLYMFFLTDFLGEVMNPI